MGHFSMYHVAWGNTCANGSTYVLDISEVNERCMPSAMGGRYITDGLGLRVYFGSNRGPNRGHTGLGREEGLLC